RQTNRLARLHGLWTLAQIDTEQTAPLLQTLLEDRDVEVAATAARILALRLNPDSAAVLARALQRTNPPLRLATAQALAHGGTRDSIPHLWQALTNTTDPFLAHGLIHAVHRLADEPILRQALTNPHPRIQ